MATSKGRINTYEGMFLFSSNAGADLTHVMSTLNHVFERAGAEVLAVSKWDERRLAYEIEKNKRGVYFLTYFKCDPVRVEGIDRDCNLNEDILRTMFLRAENITEEEMRASDKRQQLGDEAALRASEAAAEAAAEAPAPAAEEAPAPADA